MNHAVWYWCCLIPPCGSGQEQEVHSAFGEQVARLVFAWYLTCVRPMQYWTFFSISPDIVLCPNLRSSFWFLWYAFLLVIQNLCFLFMPCCLVRTSHSVQNCDSTLLQFVTFFIGSVYQGNSWKHKILWDNDRKKMPCESLAFAWPVSWCVCLLEALFKLWRSMEIMCF